MRRIIYVAIVTLLIGTMVSPPRASGRQEDAAEATITVLETEVASLQTQVASDSSEATAPPALSPTVGAPAETVLGTSRDNPAGIGQEVVSGNLAVSVSEVLRGDEALSRMLAENEYNETPNGEWEYVLMRVQVRGLGDFSEPIDVSAFDFAITGSSNVLVLGVIDGAWYGGGGDPPDPELDGGVYGGGELGGWLSKPVPVGETDVVLVFKPFSGDYSTWRYLALDEGASLPTEEPTLAFTDAGSPVGLDSSTVSSGTERSDPADFGEWVSVPDGLALQALGVLRGLDAFDRLREAGIDSSPGNGSEYVLVKARASYAGTRDGPASVQEYDFGLTGGGGALYTAELNAFFQPPLNALKATIYADGTFEGWLLFQVPEGESDLVLVYEPRSGGSQRFLVL